MLGATFIFASLVPVVCQATDVLPFIAGLILNFGIIAGWITVVNYLEY